MTAPVKKLPLLLLLLALPALAVNLYTNEVLVLASAAVQVDTGSVAAAAGGQRRGLEIQNLGPNAIYCSVGESAAAVTTKSRKLNTGDAWALDLVAGRHVYCKAVTADQVTGAATIVTEVD